MSVCRSYLCVSEVDVAPPSTWSVFRLCVVGREPVCSLVGMVVCLWGRTVASWSCGFGGLSVCVCV